MSDRQGSWRVWRQDDNGNRFILRDALSEEDARRLVDEMTAKGHKQTFWAERSGETAG